MDERQPAIPSPLIGDGLPVPCVDGVERPYLNLDSAASASALPAVARRVEEFLPWYSSVHRGAGYKSRLATNAYEEARLAALRFAGRAEGGHDIAVIVRNTTEAINHLAYRLPLPRDDVVVTTVVEHHAMLLPWGRRARRRFVEGGPEGTFSPDDVVAALDASPRPKLLAITGASNVTGWLPPLDAIPGVRLLGPKPPEVTLPLATFNIEGQHHALVAARLSAEYGIGVRYGCFCAHPYLLQLLELSPQEVAEYRAAVLRHDRREMPGAVRASAGLSTSPA